MSINSAQDDPKGNGLSSVGVLEFFDIDTNPILVFDVDNHRLIYENQALREWKISNPREPLAFSQPEFLTWVLQWSEDTKSADFALAGRTWRTSCIRKRWMVLTSHDGLNTSVAQQQGIPPTPPAITPSAPFPNSTSTEPTSRTGRNSPALSFCSSNSSAAVDAQGSGQKAHDWTRYNVIGLSAHQQMVKNFPWHTTPIGGIDTWPEALRTAVVAINANSEPRVLLWGPEHTMVYNEACAPLFGQKHPQSMGARGEDIWSEAWAALSGFISRAETEAKATRIAGMPLTMLRHGYDEETFWIANFIPMLGPKGRVTGVLDEFTEITCQVIQDRRRDIIIKLTESLTHINTLEELWSGFLQSMQRAEDDVPYCAVYTPTASSHNNPAGINTPSEPLHKFSLHGSVGLEANPSALPLVFDLNDHQEDHSGFIKACNKAWKSANIVTLQADEGTLPLSLAIGVSGRAGGVAVKTICLIPVPDLMGDNQLAFVVIALTARRPHDSGAVYLLRSVSDSLTRAASTIFLPNEQRRTRQRFQEIETGLAQQLQATSLEAERKEARYVRLFANAPVGMYVISADEKLLYHNDMYLACTGSSKARAESPEPPGNLVHEDDHDSVMKLWTSCVKDKVPITVEYRMKKEWRSVDATTGKEIVGEQWVMASATPDLDDQGNVMHVTGFMLDISERKYHEKKERQRLEETQAETRFANLATEAPMGMYLLKPDGAPIYLNDAYFDILGFTKEQFKEAMDRGVGWADQIVEEDLPIVNAAWMKLSSAGTPINIEYRVKKEWKTYDPATGSELSGPCWLQGTAFAEKDPDGNILTIQGFVTDISEKKFSERLLAERLEEALETKRQADRFIDMTSHEMRNPLSAILQSADGILTALGPDGHPRSLSLGHATAMPQDTMETVVDAAQTIILCAQHQKRIVDDILTLSKLDSNLLTISPDRVCLPVLLEKSFKMFDAELERTEIDATLEIEDGYRELGVGDVMIDSSRVLQVVINLLTNAIKFTQYSETRTIKIFLNASLARPKGSNHNASFIEQRANRTDQTDSSEWGTGQQLFLQIAIQDSGRGLNEEELKLLFQRFQQASPKTYKQYGGSGLGLFISRELTELQGGQIGVHSEAGKGSTFTFYIKARRTSGPGGSSILTPSNTPSRSNSTRTRGSSRAPSRDGTQLPNAHLGGSASPQVIVPPQRRASVMLRRAAPSPKPVVNPISSLHVLVVEDNEINQRVMANQLRRLGCTVHLAGNGLEALDFLQRTTVWNPFLEGYASVPDPAQLSVVLMDLEMPVLGGLGCVRQIRELQKEGKLLKHVPVIAVTANARSEQIAHAVECGMDSVVTKPFRIPELVPQMEALVQRLAKEHGR